MPKAIETKQNSIISVTSGSISGLKAGTAEVTCSVKGIIKGLKSNWSLWGGSSYADLSEEEYAQLKRGDIKSSVNIDVAAFYGFKVINEGGQPETDLPVNTVDLFGMKSQTLKGKKIDLGAYAHVDHPLQQWKPGWKQVMRKGASAFNWGDRAGSFVFPTKVENKNPEIIDLQFLDISYSRNYPMSFGVNGQVVVSK